MRLKDRLLEQAVNTVLAFKSRPGAIQHSLARRVYTRAQSTKHSALQVGVVQMKAELADDGVQFADKYYRLVREAVDEGAQLVVFPEYSWLPILGLLPPVRELANKGTTLESAVGELGQGSALKIEDVFRTIAPHIQRVFEATGRELASRFGIYLMPGTAITMDQQGHLYNTAYLFGPTGELVGTHHKMHATALEKEWMTCGKSLEVWQLPFGAVAAPVCMDFTFWETTRIAALRGAEILIDMSADAGADREYLEARGDESRIQECMAYSTRAFCVTKLFGLNFRGPSHIAAPLGMCCDTTTYLAKADSPEREQVIVANLDLRRLREFREINARDWNRNLYDKYLPSVYEAYRARVTQEGKRRVI